VAGANRSANPRPNVAACIANSFRSITGPTTRNASRAVSENWDRDAATNASASEQIDNNTARIARAGIDTTGLLAAVYSQVGGTTALTVAAAMAPTTRKPPACITSCRTDPQNAAPFLRPSDDRWAQPVGAAQPLPQPAHRTRHKQACREPGEDHLRVAGKRDRGRGQHDRIDRRRGQQERQGRGGRDAPTHKRPRHRHGGALAAGQAAPAIPAIGTAAAGCLGSARAKNDGGTNTATIADSSTPRTRKGRA